MFVTAALLLSSPVIDCQSVAQRLDEPITISVSRVTSQQLDPDAKAVAAGGSRVEHRFGEFTFRGYGIDIRSDDPRFAGISGFRHSCGYAVIGPSGWNALDVDHDRWTLKFFNQRIDPQERPRGATIAEEKGVVPVLEGWEPGPSWPISNDGRQFFVAAMRSSERDQESSIVAFADRPGRVPARELARVRMNIDGLSIIPDLHRPMLYLNLEEKTRTGAVRHVVMELSLESVGKIADDISRSDDR